jgi:hypothetical protein
VHPGIASGVRIRRARVRTPPVHIHLNDAVRSFAFYPASAHVVALVGRGRRLRHRRSLNPSRSRGRYSAPAVRPAKNGRPGCLRCPTTSVSDVLRHHSRWRARPIRTRDPHLGKCLDYRYNLLSRTYTILNTRSPPDARAYLSKSKAWLEAAAESLDAGRQDVAAGSAARVGPAAGGPSLGSHRAPPVGQRNRVRMSLMRRCRAGTPNIPGDRSQWSTSGSSIISEAVGMRKPAGRSS